MDLPKEEQQRDEFRKILLSLATDQLTLKDKVERSKVYQRLEKLYYAPSEEERFRHFYSDIFLVLANIRQNDGFGDINILGQNLFEIRKGYQSINMDSNGNRIDISDCIKKLYDHVSLDIARIAYSDAEYRKVSGEEDVSQLKNQMNSVQEDIRSAQKKQTDVERKLNDSQKKQKDIEQKLNDSQKEYITILGIFAAVVLAFTGGIAFSTSVLNNIAESSIYRVVLVALIIGVVLINTLFGLFYYIDRLLNKRKGVIPFLIVNIILISLIGATIIAWNAGLVESRNSHVRSFFIEQSAVIDSIDKPQDVIDSK